MGSELEAVANFIVNNGIGVGCMMYFMIRDWKYMQKLTETLSTLTVTLNQLLRYEEKRGVEDHDSRRDES